VSRGNSGGTWLHPDLAVHFARWLDVRFSIWCDRQIRTLIAGAHAHHDRKRMRHETVATHKAMGQATHLTREADGKKTGPHHYINEVRL
jgi:hypothetical protein